MNLKNLNTSIVQMNLAHLMTLICAPNLKLIIWNLYLASLLELKVNIKKMKFDAIELAF